MKNEKQIMTEEEKIEHEIHQWIDNNRAHLPLNVDSWKIIVKAKEEDKEQEPVLSFGKYNAAAHRTDKFYKAFSRIAEIKNE